MDKGNKMDDQHIVTSFDEELKDLTDGLVSLGGLAQIALRNVEQSLRTVSYTHLTQPTILRV